MALSFGPRLQAFLAEPLPAILATVDSEGDPQMVPVWFEYSNGQICLNGNTERVWLKRGRKTGKMTFIVVDPKNMFRTVQVVGRVTGIYEDRGGEHINALSHRYFGREYQNPRTGRLTVQLEPVEIKGSEGAEPWDVTNS